MLGIPLGSLAELSAALLRIKLEKIDDA